MGPKSLRHISIVYIITYSMQKKLRQNIETFSCNIFSTKNWRDPATPFWVDNHAWRKYFQLLIFKNILNYSLLIAKIIMENIHPFSCYSFLNNL